MVSGECCKGVSPDMVYPIREHLNSGLLMYGCGPKVPHVQESRDPLGPKSPKSLKKVFPGLQTQSITIVIPQKNKAACIDLCPDGMHTTRVAWSEHHSELDRQKDD